MEPDNITGFLIALFFVLVHHYWLKRQTMKIVIAHTIAVLILLVACIAAAQVYRNMDKCYNKGGKLLSDRFGGWQCYAKNSLKKVGPSTAASK